MSVRMQRAPRRLRILSASIVGGLVLALAPAAAGHAAVVGTYTTNCSSSSSAISYAITAAVGDTITVTNTSGGGIDCNVIAGGAVTGASTIPGYSNTRTFTVVGSGTMLVQSYSSSRITITITVPAAPPSPAPSPAPIVQQVGMPGTGGCASIVDNTLNWAGVVAGGWTPSWAMWPNEGRGGEVCSRTLAYNVNQGRWVIS